MTATYYVTASVCTTNNPGSGVLLRLLFKAVARAFFASVNPASVVTTGTGCTNGADVISGNTAFYRYGGANSSCSVSIILENGGTMSFVPTPIPPVNARVQHDVDITPDAQG